ncbi:hypothetical protein Ciccas_012020 [Cichlidogyrus casuarinus]|uniref:Uncharacterized protein n=1 Tax=Cichlidogyrus casuarinus TaxID=1844966 RepID=A0ABD2PPM1_9PLAT
MTEENGREDKPTNESKVRRRKKDTTIGNWDHHHFHFGRREHHETLYGNLRTREHPKKSNPNEVSLKVVHPERTYLGVKVNPQNACLPDLAASRDKLENDKKDLLAPPTDIKTKSVKYLQKKQMPMRSAWRKFAYIANPMKDDNTAIQESLNEEEDMEDMLDDVEESLVVDEVDEHGETHRRVELKGNAEKFKNKMLSYRSSGMNKLMMTPTCNLNIHIRTHGNDWTIKTEVPEEDEYYEKEDTQDEQEQDSGDIDSVNELVTITSEEYSEHGKVQDMIEREQCEGVKLD